MTNEKKANQKSTLVFEEAIEKKGWWKSHRFLILRRTCQIMILIAFTIPIIGVNQERSTSAQTIGVEAISDMKESDVRNDEFWVLKGTLANSEILHTLPLGDPFVFLQSTLAGNWYTLTGIIGVILIVGFYLLVGGRTYCSFVCPVNMVTDLAAWIRRQLRITNQLSISKRARIYILGLVLILSLVMQTIIWELVNPITGIMRVIVYGGVSIANFSIILLTVIFILDIIGAAHLWCGHLCPVGAFYGLLGKRTPLSINANNIVACDDCMDCYKACPEPYVLRPLIQNKLEFVGKSISPCVGFSDCTRCGRCIDVCPENVFTYNWSIHQFKVNKTK